MSSCRIITPKTGPNQGVETQSVLYANLLHSIKDQSKVDKLYKIPFTKKFVEWFGDWINNPGSLGSRIDTNGEPKIEEVFKFVSQAASKLGLKEVSINNDESNQAILDTYFKLTEDELKGEDPVTPTDTPDEVIAKMFRGITDYQRILIDRKNFIKEFNENKKAKFEFKDSTVNGLEALIAELGTDIENLKLNYSKGELIRIYSRMLDNIQTDASKISSFINNKANIGTDPYITVILEGKKMIESYQNLRVAVDMGMTNPAVESKMNKTIDQLNVLKDDMMDALYNSVFNLVKTNTKEDLTDEDIKKILSESYDIRPEDYAFGDVTTSTDKLLAVVGNLYKNGLNEVRENHDKIVEDIKEKADKLFKASGVGSIRTNQGYRNLFGFMIDFDGKGKFTGRLLQKIGSKYYEIKKQKTEKLYDDHGKKKDYIEITDLSKASKEDIEFNKKLYDAKKEAREFRRAEYIENGNVFDGEYHIYSEEFKKEREKFESFNGKEFAPIPGVEGTKAYTAYRNKYYSDPRDVLVGVADYNSVTQSYEYNGRTEWRSMSFVKPEHINVREINHAGNDMRDPRWVKLNNPKTDLERAQLEYYNTYIETYNKLLEKLPEKYRKDMHGKLIKLKIGLFNNVLENKESTISVLLRSFRNWWKAPEYSAQRVTDENGMVSDEIPLFYHGDFQSEKKVKAIEADLAALKNDLISKKISQETYTTKRKELTSKLNFELAKVRVDETSADLVTGLINFAHMAEHYSVMSNLEDTFTSVGEILKERKVKQKDFKGNDLYSLNEKGEKVPVIKKGMDSLAFKRFSKWMHMVVYDNADIDNSTAAIVAQKAQNVTSLSKIGLNIFSGVNNYVMGRINNTIEAAGGRYYSIKTLRRATSEFNKQLLPGIFEKLGKASISKDPFAKEKAHSKYEAFVKEYDIVREMWSGQGNPHSVLTDWLYWQTQAGEYNVQSKSGIAVLMKQTIKDNNGNEMSIYDAHDFDNKTGKLTLKPEFQNSYSKQDKNKITNMIHEINKMVHGNYSYEDRMVIQQHWLGQLGAQFHKWLYPAYKARFKPRYFDENLGTMEGRYLTLASFLKHGYKMITQYKTLSASWDEAQKANMRKNLAEFGFIMASAAMYAIFSMLAAGVPDDDENLKKFVNFLQYQQSKQITELVTLVPLAGTLEQYQLVSNPIPAMNAVKEFSQAMWQTMKIPYDYMNDSMYYERGVYEGDLKVAKEWKDVIPGLYALNRWDSFETVKSYYIK